jgi:hypothetical protein
MTTNKQNPEDANFDCLEFKRRAQAKIYADTKDMTHEEELAYYRRRANEGWIGEWWRSIKGESVVRETPTEPMDDES